jgi:predicted nuclease of predicted toxin-antitoxin system
VTTFLVDENLPRSLAPELRRAGFDAEDVRDRGLAGHEDAEVLAYAISKRRILITRDLGISDLRRFPTGSELGIILVRLPNVMATDELNATLITAVREVRSEDLRGSIVVIGPHRIRFRRTR